VRAARERLVSLHRLAAHFREVVIPLREATVALTQRKRHATPACSRAPRLRRWGAWIDAKRCGGCWAGVSARG
jgi:hypothetical protein